jgi:hypothetical protein
MCQAPGVDRDHAREVSGVELCQRLVSCAPSALICACYEFAEIQDSNVRQKSSIVAHEGEPLSGAARYTAGGRQIWPLRILPL